jgi:tripartite-type tricarboxylate transporter receptor subunit TctC
MKHLIFLLCFMLVICALSLTAPTLQAQSYPNRPIQLVIVSGPGDASDVTARLLIEELTKILNVPVMALNKPGAGSTLATDFVAKSKKDGYTLLYGNSSGVVYARASNPESVHYDPIKDLEPLGVHVVFPTLIAVRADAPWKNFSEVIEYSKKNPGKFRCGTLGVGSINHFHLEIIRDLTGAEITMIPFKGATPAVTALLGGHTEAAFIARSLFQPHYESGKMRGILVDRKMPDIPDIPTLSELGYKRDLPLAWFALWAPAGVPAEVKEVLVPALEKAIKVPELKPKIEKLGFIFNYKSPE